MESNKKLNDLIINLKPKVIRFTGEKFPNELWNSRCQIKKNKKISSYTFNSLLENGFLGIFFKHLFDNS